MSYDILVLNPGSTSTKAAVYRDERPLMVRSMVHSNPDLAPYPALNDQLDYRVGMTRSWLALEGYDLSGLSAVVGRGGIIPNIVSGGYLGTRTSPTACCTTPPLTTPPTWGA